MLVGSRNSLRYFYVNPHWAAVILKTVHKRFCSIRAGGFPVDLLGVFCALWQWGIGSWSFRFCEVPVGLTSADQELGSLQAGSTFFVQTCSWADFAESWGTLSRRDRLLTSGNTAAKRHVPPQRPSESHKSQDARFLGRVLHRNNTINVFTS